MNKKHIQLDNKDVFNNDYILTVFYLKTYGGIDLIDAASEIASESSNGLIFESKSVTTFSDSLSAFVYKVDRDKELVYIAYPKKLFSSTGDVQNILTAVNGNILSIKELAACKLLDIWFPSSMIDSFDGPSTSIDELRSYLQVYNRPLVGTSIRPKVGLTPEEYADCCYEFWSGGGDFIKNDNLYANQEFCPFEVLVKAVRRSMDKVESEIGKLKIHSFNLSSPDLNTVIERAEIVRREMKPGSYAFMIEGIMNGWPCVQTLRRSYPEVFIDFNRAGYAAITRPENPFGMDASVLTKFARLSGASSINIGTFGVESADSSTDDEVKAIRLALRLGSNGYFLEQTWGFLPTGERDLQEEIRFDQKLNSLGFRKIVQIHHKMLNKHHAVNQTSAGSFFAQNWKGLKKMCTMVSGGLNPLLIWQFLELMENIDCIVILGGGVYSHPMGIKSGVESFIRSYEAWEKKIDINEYAKNNESLRSGIEFYENRSAESHRVDKNNN